jgi:hypothetical protein
VLSGGGFGIVNRRNQQMVELIKLILLIASWLVDKRSEADQRKIGEDEAVREALLNLSIRTRVAKTVSLDSGNWTASDIDERLRDYYRNEQQS